MPILGTISSLSARAFGFTSSSSIDFTVSPSVSGLTEWSLASNGVLILDGGTQTSYTLVAQRTFSTTVKMWGQGGQGEGYGGQGGYSTGSISFSSGQTYTIRLNTGGGYSNPGSGSGLNRGERGGGYAGIFYGGVSLPSSIMIAGGGGGGAPPIGGSGSARGGNGGGSSGSNGGNSPDSVTGSSGGSGGTQGGPGGGGSGSGSPGASPGAGLQGGRCSGCLFGDGAVLLGDMVQLANARVHLGQAAGLFRCGHGNISHKACRFIRAAQNFGQAFPCMADQCRPLIDLLSAVRDQCLDFAG